MKKSLLAFILVGAMLLSGCSLVLKDQSVDNQLPILDVNGEIVTKQNFNDVYNYNVYMEEYYNSMFASMFGTSNPIDTDAILEDTVNFYINSIVTNAKATELGFDQFTAEEEADLSVQAQAEYDENISLIEEMYFAGSELTEEELAKEVEAYALANGVTLEQVLSSVRSTTISDRLKASVTDLITEVDDTQLQAYLDEQIAAEKADYASSPSAWGAAKNSGETSFHTPAGYRTVRVIELSKPVAAEGEEVAPADDVKAQMDALYARLTAGEAFDALSDDIKTYVVCESSIDLDEALVTAAMQLPAIGSVSPIIETDSSYLIVEYTGDVAEASATLAEVRDMIYDDVLTAVKDEAYNEALAQWIQDANVKVYYENLTL